MPPLARLAAGARGVDGGGASELEPPSWRTSRSGGRLLPGSLPPGPSQVPPRPPSLPAVQPKTGEDVIGSRDDKIDFVRLRRRRDDTVIFIILSVG